VNWIAHAQMREIVDLRLAAHEHETWHNLAEFLDAVESPEARSLVTGAVADGRKMPNPDTQLADVTLRLRNLFLDRRMAELIQKISLPETADEERVAMLHEQARLREAKRLPLAARDGGDSSGQ